MYKIIDAPYFLKGEYFEDAELPELAEYDRIAIAEWLYQYALDNEQTNGNPMSDWAGAEDIMDAYAIIFQDQDNGARVEIYPSKEMITDRGAQILEQAIAGADEHEVEEMFDAWREED